jgi:hypothetical protein
MPMTDDDVLRELLHHATDDLHAPAAVATGIVARHRRARNARVLSVATTGVAAAAVVATVAVTNSGPAAPGKTVAAPKPPVVNSAAPSKAAPATKVPATKLPPVTLDAAQELDKLSVAAGSAPQQTGRYVALTEVDKGTGENYTRVSVFDSLTGDGWTYQDGTGYEGNPVPSELPEVFNFSPTAAEFASWPTDPVKLRAFLQSPAAATTPVGQTASSSVPGQTPDDLVFQEATFWLYYPLVPSELRSALYKVLASVPGVQVKGGVTDSTGRPAIEVSRYDSVAKQTSTTFEDPSTGAVLEQDFSYSGGTITSVYKSVTSSATLPANPFTNNASASPSTSATASASASTN